MSLALTVASSPATCVESLIVGLPKFAKPVSLLEESESVWKWWPYWIVGIHGWLLGYWQFEVRRRVLTWLVGGARLSVAMGSEGRGQWRTVVGWRGQRRRG